MRRAVLVIAVVAILLVVAAELATRAASPYLREPQLYGDEATQVKVQQLEARGPSCTDVVVVGDSMARDAFVPSTFTAEDPAHRSAYNASLDAASPELLERWVGEEVQPRVSAPTVVIVVSSLDLNAGATATRSARAAYDDALATAGGPLGHTQRWFVDHSSLVRHRGDVRDPQQVADAIERWRAGTPAGRTSAEGLDGLLGADGAGLSRQRLVYRGDPGSKLFTRDQLLAGYRVDDAQVQALRTLVDDLRAHGTRVALVVLPVTADYVTLHPRGTEDFTAFTSAVANVGRDTGVPVLDVHDLAPPPDAFADTHHLNATGAQWITTELAHRLATAGVLADRRCA